MKSPAKLFVCEFITGGGFNHVALNKTLVHEGEIMRDALLRDLSLLPYEIHATVDARVAPPIDCHAIDIIHDGDDVWEIWQQIIASVDAVWLIAPETDDMLEKMTEMAVKQNKLVLGCDVTSIKITASKIKTYEMFRDTDVSVLPTFTVESWEGLKGGAWVAKPDDGVGCEETLLFESKQLLKDWIVKNKALQNYVIQPYQSGMPASISCVFYAGNVHLLSCNEQLIILQQNVFSFKGVIVNGMVDYWLELEQLAEKIAQTIPGLKGYVGIDVIIKKSPEGSVEITLVEINPRMTTSYVALAESTGANPAAMIIDALTDVDFNWPKLHRNKVQVDLCAS